MNVLEVSSMPDGTKIQIENWNTAYDFYSPNSTIGAYPVSKKDGERQFAPKRNKTFRLSFNFPNEEEAKKAFEQLKNGSKQLLDFREYIDDSRKLQFL